MDDVTVIVAKVYFYRLFENSNKITFKKNCFHKKKIVDSSLSSNKHPLIVVDDTNLLLLTNNNNNNNNDKINDGSLWPQFELITIIGCCIIIVFVVNIYRKRILQL